jgi:molybdopterin synthase sulfur carrier subunit
MEARLTRVESDAMRIRFHATLRDAVGGREPDVDLTAPFTAQALVDHVVARWPAAREWLLDADGSLRSQVHVFVNGRDARYLDDGLGTTIRDDDQVDVFPAVGGG